MSPNGKRGAALGVPGALATVLLWLLHDVFGLEVTPEVAGAFAVLLVGAGQYLVRRL